MAYNGPFRKISPLTAVVILDRCRERDRRVMMGDPKDGDEEHRAARCIERASLETISRVEGASQYPFARVRRFSAYDDPSRLSSLFIPCGDEESKYPRYDGVFGGRNTCTHSSPTDAAHNRVTASYAPWASLKYIDICDARVGWWNIEERFREARAWRRCYVMFLFHFPILMQPVLDYCRRLGASLTWPPYVITYIHRKAQGK
jgi:hypothetical protein